MTFEFCPPLPVKPSYEMYAEFLLEAGKYKEAQAEFNRALARAPRRSLSLQGLALAAKQSGDAQVAKDAQTELQNIRRKADAPHPIEECSHGERILGFLLAIQMC